MKAAEILVPGKMKEGDYPKSGHPNMNNLRLIFEKKPENLELSNGK